LLKLFKTGALSNGEWENYERKKLGTITEITSGGTPSRPVQEYWGGNIPWIKSGELLDGDIANSEEQITKKGLENSSAKLFPKDTILVALYGQGKTRGKTGRLVVEGTTNQACCAILPNPSILLPRYVQYWIRELYWELRKKAVGGAQPNWNSGTIKVVEITIPPLDEQEKIVSTLDTKFLEFTKLEELIKRIKEKRTEFKRYFDKTDSAILNQAFSGKLIS